MTQVNQKQEKTSDFIFIDAEGTGTVTMEDFSHRDVDAVGYLIAWGKWKFIIHHDPECPKYFVVSEASTGGRINQDNYYDLESALYFIVSRIKEKRYHFSTAVSNILVKTQCNLTARNTTGIQTLAINSLLW